MDSSPFDDIGAQAKWSDEEVAEFNRRDELYHRVFSQSEAGKQLLELWVEHLQVSPADISGNDLYNLGKEEGAKTFIRNILLTIRKVENE